MQALVLNKDGLNHVDNYPRPEPAQHEALIRILVAGICATDLELIKGYAGFAGVPGHEFVGVVEETEDPAWLGKTVVGNINLGCRECSVCLASGMEHCPNRKVLGIIQKDGVFADYTTLPVANLVEVPRAVPPREAVFVEPLAAALRIMEQIHTRPSSRIAVVGPGRLGILAAQVLKLKGSDVTVLGRTASSLQLPQEIGISTGFVGDSDAPCFDVVVEATGNSEGFRHSLRLVRPMGTLVLKSTFAGDTAIDMTRIVVDEISVIGSRCGPFAPALQLLVEHKILVAGLIDGEFSLKDGITALARAAEPGVRKVLMYPEW